MTNNAQPGEPQPTKTVDSTEAVHTTTVVLEVVATKVAVVSEDSVVVTATVVMEGIATATTIITEMEEAETMEATDTAAAIIIKMKITTATTTITSEAVVEAEVEEADSEIVETTTTEAAVEEETVVTDNQKGVPGTIGTETALEAVEEEGSTTGETIEIETVSEEAMGTTIIENKEAGIIVEGATQAGETELQVKKRKIN